MSVPKRIQRKRTKGWKMPPNTIYVGRPTYWGNPYDIEPDTPCSCGCCNVHEGTTPEEVVRLFELWISKGKPTVLDFDESTKKLVPHKVPSQEEIRERLKGKNLACWCPLDKICHADILLKIANA